MKIRWVGFVLVVINIVALSLVGLFALRQTTGSPDVLSSNSGPGSSSDQYATQTTSGGSGTGGNDDYLSGSSGPSSYVTFPSPTKRPTATPYPVNSWTPTPYLFSTTTPYAYRSPTPYPTRTPAPFVSKTPTPTRRPTLTPALFVSPTQTPRTGSTSSNSGTDNTDNLDFSGSFSISEPSFDETELQALAELENTGETENVLYHDDSAGISTTVPIVRVSPQAEDDSGRDGRFRQITGDTRRGRPTPGSKQAQDEESNRQREAEIRQETEPGTLPETTTSAEKRTPEDTATSVSVYTSRYAETELEDNKAYLLTPSRNSVVSDTVPITLRAPAGSNLDIQLEIPGRGATLFIGRVSIPQNEKETVFYWNTANVPNGQYRLLAASRTANGELVLAGPIITTVKNLQFELETPATPQTVVLPDEFTPETVDVDSAVSVTAITNTKPVTTEESTAITLAGTGAPNTIITLLIYSEPIVVTVKTDANGTWTYTLEKPLPTGKHTAYVVASQADGTNVRSQVSEFFIAPGFAASRDGESLVLASATEDEPLKNFMLLTAVMIVGGVVGLLVLFSAKMNAWRQTS